MSLSIAHSSTTPTASLDEAARLRLSLQESQLFRGLPVDAVDDLARRMQVRRVQAGNSIISQGDMGDTMFLIARGRVKSVIFGETGREVTLAYFRAGQTFGEVALFDAKPRHTNYLAVEPCTLLNLSRESLFAHLRSFPGTAANMLSQMSNRLRRSQENVAQLALCDVNERLVYQLVSLAEDEGVQTDNGYLLHRRPTQQELANMIGSCRETISRSFNQLAKGGYIVPNGRSLVVTWSLIEKSGKELNVA